MYKTTNSNTISGQDTYRHHIHRFHANINWTMNSTLISKYNNLLLPPEGTLDRFSWISVDCDSAYIRGPGPPALNGSSTRGSESSGVLLGGLTDITVDKSPKLISYTNTDVQQPTSYCSGYYGLIVGINVVVVVLLLARCLYKGVCRSKKAEISSELAAQELGLSVLTSRLEVITVDKAVEFSYEELSTATNDFSLANEIGQGGFGSVYYAELRGEKAAIKKMDMRASKEFLAELRVLTRVHHLNLVCLLGYCVKGSHFLVYEYVENGNLSQHLHGSGPSERDPLPWSIRVQIALDSARGLEYIHEYTVPIFIHCDIKSDNILIDKNFNGKVADFGLTRLTEVGSRSRVLGTFGYMPPEYAQYGEVSPKVDVYAFGVVLYELISAKKAIIRANDAAGEPKGLISLFDEFLSQANPKDELVKMIDPRLGDNYPLDSVMKMAQLAKSCTNVDPQQRPSMRSIVVALMNLSSSSEK